MTAQGFFEDLQSRVPQEAFVRHVSLAGRSVLLRSTCERFLQAFGHLPQVTAAPDLTIHAWESADRPYWDTGRQEVFHLVSDRYSASYEGDRLFAYDRETRQGYFWTPSLDALNASERATPLRPILHWWAHQNGLQLVHGAVVGYPQASVLLAGSGGAGKSTTALACLDHMDILGDDYCLIEGQQAWSVYCMAKLDDASLERLGLKLLAFERDTGPKQKHILDLRSRGPALQATLRVVVAPSIGSPTRLKRISPAKALAALAPSTMFQLPGGRQESFRRLRSIVAPLPCYALTVGDPNQVPEIFDDIIERLIW